MVELTGLPGEGPATLPGVRAFLRIPATDTQDDTRLELVVAAVNSLVRCWPCSEASVGAEEFTANVVEGANLMAGRLFRRRESPAGVAAFGDQGPVYVMRNDPDVAQLLQLGSWATPRVG
jgi:hypothetical protein